LISRVYLLVFSVVNQFNKQTLFCLPCKKNIRNEEFQWP
jgi:hypothetical protein